MAILLRGLTSRDGGMVCRRDPSGLPEQALEGRNPDYRYAWIRDQCCAGITAAAHANFPLLGSALRFRPRARPRRRLRAQTGVHRPRRGCPGPDALWLISAATQEWRGQGRQLGPAGGSSSTLSERSSGCCGPLSPGHLDTGHWKAVEAAAAAIEARWGDADAGIWEIDNQHWAHSRLTCVSGLRAAAAEAPSKRVLATGAPWRTRYSPMSRRTACSNGRWQLPAGLSS